MLTQSVCAALHWHLDDTYQSCWVSQHGLDGTIILEPLGPDGRTPSEVAAAEEERLAQERLDEEQRAVEEEAARKKVVFCNVSGLLDRFIFSELETVLN